MLLLPKLRSHYAEFLNRSSLDRLGILYLPTCVGLGYGHQQHSLEVFLESMGSLTSSHSTRHQLSGLMWDGFAYPTPYSLSPGRPTPGTATLLRHPIGDSALPVVQECPPVVHRLRLAASP